MARIKATPKVIRACMFIVVSVVKVTQRVHNEYTTSTAVEVTNTNQHVTSNMYRFYVRGGGGVGVGAGAAHCPRAFAKHEQFAGLVAEIGQGDSFLQRPLALKTLFEGFVGGQSFPFTDVAVVVAEQKRRRKEREVDREREREKKRTGRRETHKQT